MPVRSTQFGRLGAYVRPLIDACGDPDRRAASLYAVDGSLKISRPTYSVLLERGGFIGGRVWQEWAGSFLALRSACLLETDRLLRPRCTDPRPLSSTDPRPLSSIECWHELTPPLSHYSLVGFVKEMGSLPNNLVVENGGFRRVGDTWNFVITQEGEIIICKEHYGVIKHTCLSGGRRVWSAGEVGIWETGIQMVDLHSGHYIDQGQFTNASDKEALIRFTREVFQEYSNRLISVPCLNTGFDCVWNMRSLEML